MRFLLKFSELQDPDVPETRKNNIIKNDNIVPVLNELNDLWMPIFSGLTAIS